MNVKPQLVMVRDTLEGLPGIDLPAGYGIRAFRAGDEVHWERIIGESFGPEGMPGSFDSVMRNSRSFEPGRIFFVVRHALPVATASAWYRPEYGKEYGYLHYVGCAGGHRGKGLGRAVSCAALHRMREEGRTRAVLRTDDFRIPALKTYLKLGFVPLLLDENQRGRWRKILLEIDAGLPDTFRDILSGPPCSRACFRRG